jgi:hypothetical protein
MKKITSKIILNLKNFILSFYSHSSNISEEIIDSFKKRRIKEFDNYGNYNIIEEPKNIEFNRNGNKI